MGLVEGIKSSMFDMRKSQSWADWKDEWFWMLTYFSGGVWYILMMQNAPRVKYVKDIP
jgi:hypothetical protein